MKKYIFGVTGNISSGKSFLLKIFPDISEKRKMNLHIIDVDQLRRYILIYSKKSRHIILRKELNEKLGLSLNDNDIKINGELPGEKIFHDKGKMLLYKKIVNPEIFLLIKEEIEKFNGLIAVEWAMLAEDNMLNIVNNNVILVKCNERTVKMRTINPDIPESQMLARINFQTNVEDKIKIIQEKIQSDNKGFLILFDTSNNPKIDAYEDLFNNLIKQLHYE